MVKIITRAHAEKTDLIMRVADKKKNIFIAKIKR